MKFGTIIITLLLLVVYMFLSGLYYQTQSDIVFPTYIFGFYSNGSNALPHTFGCFSFISSLMNFLSSFLKPEIIYDGFQVVVVFVSITILLKSFYNRIHFNQFSDFLFAFLLIIFLADFFRPFEFTKSAFILAFAALYPNINKKAFSSLSIILLGIAFLIRPEPVVLTLFVIILFEAINIFQNHFNIKVILFCFKKYTVPLITIVLLSFLINYGISEEDVHYKSIRPYEYVLSDFDRKIEGLNFNSTIDTIKLKAAINFFYADKEQINIDFFNRVGVDKMDKTPFSILCNLVARIQTMDINNNLSTKLSNTKYYFITALFLCVFLIYYKSFYLAIYLLLSVFLVIIIAILFKPEYHFITPLLSIIILIVLNVIFKTQNFKVSGNIYIILITIIVFTYLSYQLSVFQNNLLNDAKSRHQYFSTIMADIESHPPEQLIILNISVWDEFHYKLFSKIQPENYNNIILMDGGILYINSHYQNRVFQKTGEKKFIDQWEFILQEFKPVVYSSEDRQSFIYHYMKVVHGIKFDYDLIKRFELSEEEAKCCTFNEVNKYVF